MCDERKSKLKKEIDTTNESIEIEMNHIFNASDHVICQQHALVINFRLV